MHIEWNITKKRGNFRPVLTYTITLTDFEKSLAMASIRIESTIPKPPESGWTHCWPDEHERGNWEPAEYYTLQTPSHKTKDSLTSIKLPWKDSNEYPEVEASFTLLRDTFELALQKAMGSTALDERGELSTSAKAKKVIAPSFAAERILNSIQRKSA